MSKVIADALSKTEIEYTNSFAKLWFDKFNEKYFNNKLKDINVYWSSSMEPNACFSYQVDVFAKKIIPVYIQLNKSNISKFDVFRNALVHEMLHYLVDCYLLNPTDAQWFEAVKLKMTKGEKEYLSVLNLGSDKCHLGDWERIARELNSKHKELNITAFGERDIGLNSSKIDFDNLHLVCVRYRNNETGREEEKYKTYDKEKFKEILKHIKEYKSKAHSKIEYYFYELELDKNKLSTSGITISLANDIFNESFISYLHKSGVIKKGVTFLGKSNNYKPFSVV